MKTLIAVSGHAVFDDGKKNTGYWLGEVTHFIHELAAAGMEFDFVSPTAGVLPIDPRSLRMSDALDRQFQAHPQWPARLNAHLLPAQVNPDDYQAIYYAGGHGAMWDLAADLTLRDVAENIYARGGVVSAVCHGVAGLLPLRKPGGRPLIEGQPVTGFSNLEEGLILLTRAVPYLLENELKRRGGLYHRGFPYQPHVEWGQRLLSGQNPQSTTLLAKELVAYFQKTEAVVEHSPA